MDIKKKTGLCDGHSEKTGLCDGHLEKTGLCGGHSEKTGQMRKKPIESRICGPSVSSVSIYATFQCGILHPFSTFRLILSLGIF